MGLEKFFKKMIGKFSKIREEYICRENSEEILYDFIPKIPGVNTAKYLVIDFDQYSK